MKKAIFAAVLALVFAAPARAKDTISDLHSGRYAVKVSGLLCTACARAVVTELSKLDQVQEAKGDFESGLITLVIKNDRTLPASALRKALKRAGKRVDLGTKFDIVSVSYRPAL